MPRLVTAIAALSRSRSSTFGARPAATSRWVASIRLAALQRHDDGAGGAGDARDLHPVAQDHAFGSQPRDDDRGKLRVILAEQGGGFQHGDARAKAAMRLRHLHADRPAADDHQVSGPLAIAEHGLVGEIGHGIEAGDRRRGRPRACGDDEAAGTNLLAARIEGVR